ncbi:BA14K family protein [Rhizobium jaguaris]|uniref:Lectin-like protein BA14k n=1 Tax=Rhizobium jaguaris TaxID=1312183 RepID=A0A387FKT8_9HYPH|nr:BA14K family protein [Rhizobium jaguaris]
MKKLAVAIIAASTALAGVGEAYAFPIVTLTVPEVSSKAQPVQYRRGDQPRRGSNQVRRPRRSDRWYNGYRGSRYHRHGYRRSSNGWWYPVAAFGAGALIGAAAARPAPVRHAPVQVVGLPPRHVQWCTNRWRTYRVSDNTFVPRVGERAVCRSPYF